MSRAITVHERERRQLQIIVKFSLVAVYRISSSFGCLGMGCEALPCDWQSRVRLLNVTFVRVPSFRRHVAVVLRGMVRLAADSACGWFLRTF